MHEFSKGRAWGKHIRNPCLCRGVCHSWGSNIRRFSSGYSKFIYNWHRQHKKRNQFWLLEHGVVTVEVIIYLTILLFVLFGSVDFTVTLLKYMQAEQVKEFYLDCMRIDGWLSSEMYSEMEARFADLNMEIVGIEGAVEIDIANNTRAHIPLSEPVKRNTVDVTNSKISLILELEPEEKPFFAGRLLGISEGDNFTYIVGGETYSELPE